MSEYTLTEIERIVYIWARYSGKRDNSKEGKRRNKWEIKELAERLVRYAKYKYHVMPKYHLQQSYPSTILTLFVNGLKNDYHLNIQNLIYLEGLLLL